MREIKFKAWDLETKTWSYSPDINEIDDALQWFGSVEDADFIGIILCQYTGLKDKNGKEIYEGDIIVSDYEKWWRNQPSGVVEYLENGFWLAGKDGNRFMPNEDSRRVVGNIYENPELLDKKT